MSDSLFSLTGRKIAQLSSFNFRKSSKKQQVLDTHVKNFAFSSCKPDASEEIASECLRCLWPFLWVARFLGVCPVLRKGNNIVVTKLNPYWIFTCIGFCLQSIMLANSVKDLFGKVKISDEWVDEVNAIIYYGHTFGNTLFVLWKVRQLPSFFIECKKVEIMCKKYKESRQDDGLIKDCIFICGFFSATQLLGNVLYYYSIADKANATSVATFFQAFNDEFIGEWGSYYTGLFFCLGEFYCDMGWAVGDILLGLLSMVLARYFTRLNKEVAIRGTHSIKEIEEIRADHRTIALLIEYCNQFFSPLFLLTYIANVTYLLSRLYVGLGDDLRDPVLSVKIESIYAFLYQIFVKILIPSYLAAQLHTKAHEALQLIHNWPSSIEASDVDQRLLVIGRFISQLVTDQIGISGMGYFLITKGFLVTLLSVLITYEVVILQFQAASLASK